MKNNNMRMRKIWLSSADEEFEKTYRFALINNMGYRIVMYGEKTTRHDVYDFWRKNHRMTAFEQRWYDYSFVIEGSFSDDTTSAVIYKKNYKIDGERSQHKSWPSYMKQKDVAGPRTRVATIVLDHEKTETSIEVPVDAEIKYLCEECTACIKNYRASTLVEFYRKVLAEIQMNYFYDYFDQEADISFREYLNERK